MKFPRTTSLIAASLICCGFINAQDLIITGVMDATLSGGNPKVVEFYALDDIADLSEYGFGSANNAGGSDGEEFTFSGSASAGDFLYVASASNGGEAAFNQFFGFQADFFDSASSINGDDAIELFWNDSLVDLFGDQNGDAETQGWFYQDGWAYRDNGSIDPTTSFSISDWSFSGEDALNGISSSGTTPFGTFAPVPEPSTYALIGGILALGIAAYRRRK